MPKSANDNAIKEFLNNSAPKVGPTEATCTSCGLLNSVLTTFVILSKSLDFSSINLVLIERIAFKSSPSFEFTLIICSTGFSILFASKFARTDDNFSLSIFYYIFFYPSSNILRVALDFNLPVW